jgi:hypothetical protein
MLPGVISREPEPNIWCNMRGRIIFSLPSVGLPRTEWNEVKAQQTGSVTDSTLPTGPFEREIIYHAPFTKCDRKKDYAEVWNRLENQDRTSAKL